MKLSEILMEEYDKSDRHSNYYDIINTAIDEYMKNFNPKYWVNQTAFNILVTEIQKLEDLAEANEDKYLKLPVDFDGKPWKIGDKFNASLGGSKEKTVAGYSIYSETVYLVSEGGNTYPVNQCTRPPAPDSWEKLEDDFISEIIFCPRINGDDSKQAESILSRIRTLREKE